MELEVYIPESVNDVMKYITTIFHTKNVRQYNHDESYHTNNNNNDTTQNNMINNNNNNTGGDTNDAFDQRVQLQQQQQQYMIYGVSSRIVWLGLVPLLFESKSSYAIHAIQYMLQQQQEQRQYGYNCHTTTTTTSTSSRRTTEQAKIVQQNDNHRNRYCNTITTNTTTTNNINHRLRLSLKQYCRYRRRYKVRTIDNNNHNQMLQNNDNQMLKISSTNTKQRKKLYTYVIYIIPPIITSFEYHWTQRLITWEHRYIQAQSMMGYISTLGGGFFLCHHFHTAIQLAHYQQQLAILLNDCTMYYTCYIHMVYSYIYNGQFRIAKSIIRQVKHNIMILSQSSIYYQQKLYIVLRMCHSAQLFCQRMHNVISTIPTAAHVSTARNNKQISIRQQQHQQLHHASVIQFDNYQRVRVVPDKSKDNDLVIPFSKRVI